MKKILAFTICCLLLVIAAFSQTKFVNVQTLNLRSTPEISSDNILLQLNQGDEVTVISVTGDWAQVEYEGTEGYVFNRYLATPSSGNQVTHQTATMVLICNSSSAYAYHSHMCNGLSRCTHGVSKVTEQEAVQRGYRPCKICYR